MLSNTKKPENGLQLTRQRKAILEAVRSSRQHLDAASVYDVVRGSLPRISLGTVYRGLGALKDAGLLTEIVGAGPSRYDGSLEIHQHLICSSCGKIADLCLPADELIQAALEASGFASIDTSSLDLHGLCKECA